MSSTLTKLNRYWSFRGNRTKAFTVIYLSSFLYKLIFKLNITTKCIVVYALFIIYGKEFPCKIVLLILAFNLFVPTQLPIISQKYLSQLELMLFRNEFSMERKVYVLCFFSYFFLNNHHHKIKSIHNSHLLLVAKQEKEKK